MSAGAQPEPAASPPLPPWLKGLLAFSLFAGVPAVAGVVWFMAMLMLAFSADAGVADQGRSELGQGLLNAGMGLVAAMGMPAALAVVVEPLRKPMLGLSVGGALLGGVCALAGVVAFLTAL